MLGFLGRADDARCEFGPAIDGYGVLDTEAARLATVPEREVADVAAGVIDEFWRRREEANEADDPAGARIDQTTLERARSLGLDPAHFLSDNDSTGFFSRLGDLVETGPTWTNVNDFRAIVVDRP